FVSPTALEFINSNGVNALLVGGLNNVDNAQSPITVADSDNNGHLSGWRPFGQGLPNSPVSALSYNPSVDVLAVGTFGRGVAALYDVTSYFKQATVLQFGLANNDSQPDASYLTDGTNLDGSTFVRPLNKYGTGTLMIAGNAGYTGGHDDLRRRHDARQWRCRRRLDPRQRGVLQRRDKSAVRHQHQ